MAWRWSIDKSLIWTNNDKFTDAYMCHCASMSKYLPQFNDSVNHTGYGYEMYVTLVVITGTTVLAPYL